MPWHYKRPAYYRRRRLWRRRPRRPFRRRFWRRKRRYYSTVRKRKLPALSLKEYQPLYIRKLKVTGQYPLYITTHARLSNNMNIYLDSIAPHFVPSNGGFSVNLFTLEGLYGLFNKARCWWTQSNNDYPLIRFLGTTIRLYKSENSDYMFTYHNCFPMNATLETYQATQPTIMQLHKHRILMRCKKWNPYRKPYKKIHIHPPAQWKNKWYFQQEVAQIPLLMVMATACSFDRWYANSSSISTTIGFTSLNTKLIQLHDFAKPSTSGWHPKDGVYWYSYTGTIQANWQQVKLSNLIYLGNTETYTVGQAVGQTWNNYTSTKASWGNPFHSDYLTNKRPVFSSTNSPQTLASQYSTPTQATFSKAGISPLAEPILIPMRYNPYNDRGDQNEVYLVSIQTATQGWQPPALPSVLSENLPLWLSLWGYIDFQKRANTVQKVDTLNCIVLHTKYIEPKDLPQIVPIDEDMINGRSPYRPKDNIAPHDLINWHPKTAFQYQSCNEICASGPGTVKLPPNVSAEGHINFTFHFKLGGCAAPEKTIVDPEKQPKFPTPSNLLKTTSLQSPATSLQSYLYNFDWRRDFLTEKAEKRLKKYSGLETTLFDSAGTSVLSPETSPKSSQETDSSTEEAQEKTLQQLLIRNQHRQRLLKRGILKLIQEIQNLQ
nr:MAG: ORF1 [TTV-like mini virus]